MSRAPVRMTRSDDIRFAQVRASREMYPPSMIARQCSRSGALDQYTRFFGLMYSTSSVSVYSWTGR